MPTSPAVILVETQMGENIGATARAMANFGLSDLRLVTPRMDWPSPQAEAMAVSAVDIVKNARIYTSLEAALEDIHISYAATARPRYMVKPVLSSKELGAHTIAPMQAGKHTALLFGPERTGLTNEQIALANYIVTIPVNPQFSSLNLAQSVVLLSYEWFTAQQNLPVLENIPIVPELATHGEVTGLFDHLEGALEQKGFFKTADKKPGMITSIRNIFKRIELTSQDVRTLRGIIRSLTGDSF